RVGAPRNSQPPCDFTVAAAAGVARAASKKPERQGSAVYSPARPLSAGRSWGWVAGATSPSLFGAFRRAPSLARPARWRTEVLVRAATLRDVPRPTETHVDRRGTRRGVSGSSARKGVGVRVPASAPFPTAP